MSNVKNDGVTRMYRGFHPEFDGEKMMFVKNGVCGTSEYTGSCDSWLKQKSFGSVDNWACWDIDDNDIAAIESMTLVWERDENKQTKEGE